MSREIVSTHQDCPHCGSRDCYTIYDDGSGYCHSGTCGGKFYGAKPVEPVSAAYLEVRGISADVCKLYGIQSQLDDKGKVVRYAFRYPSNVKYRSADRKDFWWKEKGGSNALFGPVFNSGTSKRIYLTEGEFDAASLYLALGGSYPVMSIPSSSSVKRGLPEWFAYLDAFPEIVLCLDNDEPGMKARDAIAAAFPAKTYYVPMTAYKDANEFIQAGKADDLKWAALRPQRYTPENFYMTEEHFASIFEEPTYSYIPTGVEDLDEKIKGITRGVITLVTAQEGVGKSELVGFFEHRVLANDKEAKVAVMHLEETKAVVLGRLASYLAGENLKYAGQDPDKKAEALRVLQTYTEEGRLVVMDMRAHDSPYALLDHIRVAHTVYGVDYFFIDHIHQVAEQGTDEKEDERKLLDSLSSRLARMCRDYHIAVVLVSHVNDEGKTRSSRMIRKQAGVVLDLERDINNDDEEIRNVTEVTCSKNRPWGRTGSAGSLFYDSTTGLIREYGG